MTSINLHNNGYYQLSGQASGSQTGLKTQSASLASALSSASAGNGTVSNDAYVLNLSEEAKSYLNGLKTSISTPASATAGQNSFALSREQRHQISDIIEKYKNAPLTQETFDKIQDDLSAAGLDADRLARIDQAKSFNPTSELINALNGKADDTLPGQRDDSASKQKSENYMQQIITLWRGSSTTKPEGDKKDSSIVQAVSGSEAS